MLKEGKTLAIIAAVTVERGRGQAEDCTVCELRMIVTQGDERGARLWRRYFYKDVLPDVMKKELLRMGYDAQRSDDVEAIRQALVGKIALVSIRREGERLCCYLEQYMGSDDPARFYPQK